tara:strand:+ start:5096 stop:6820 length:1725 start_codon:yes stop_codon:yes gene_type:complete
MIRFHKVRFRNFGSFGNNGTEIHLDRHKTTLVSGMNGHGKSFALLDSITFALFGKPFRKINIPQLVNSINEKDCYVEVHFSVGEDDYVVHRGVKPKVFEIYKNKELIDQNAKAKDYQKMLEENILKMNYKSFTQVVILGSSSFVPFMQLSAADRREVIEDVLDIQVFSDMNTVLKTRVSLKKEEIKDLETRAELLKSKISMLESHIASLKEQDDSKVSSLTEELELTESTIESYEKNVDALLEEQSDLINKTGKVDKVKSDLSKYENMRKIIQQTHDKNVKKIEDMEKMDQCPTCTQSVPEVVKTELINKFETKREELSNGLDDIATQIQEKNEALDELREYSARAKEVHDQIVKKRSEVESSKKYSTKLRKEIADIQKKTSETDQTENATTLKKYKKEMADTRDEKVQLKEDAVLLGAVGNLLKDTGIKSKIIRHYLPVMNKLINKYLTDMGFFAQFTLDENFNETIKSRHRDQFSYMSFSEGEKMRIDLALLLAWREIARLKNSANTNLLILDEVFDSSLDTVGTDEFLKLMSVLSANTNVFVISHKSDQLVDKFDNQITFVKKGNFSKLTG